MQAIEVLYKGLSISFMSEDLTTKNIKNERRAEAQIPIPFRGDESALFESKYESAANSFSRIFSLIYSLISNFFREIIDGIAKPSGPGFYWRAFSKRRGLVFDAGPPSSSLYYKLEGIYRNCRLQIETGASIKYCGTIVQAYFPLPLGEGLCIYPESELWRDMSSHLREDIAVGDKAFDDAFVVKGGFEDSVRRRLNPHVRDRLLKFWSILEPRDRFDINDHRIRYEFPNFVENPETLMPLINLMIGTVDAITNSKESIFIKSVRAAERCDICHKSDLFDTDLSYCRRCDHVSA